MSGVAILIGSKHCNSTILPTGLVNTCKSMCKRLLSHRLNLQFLTFFPPLICDIVKQPYIEKNLLLFYVIVGHLLVNDSGEDRWSKNNKV